MLDPDKAKQLSCKTCMPMEQALRNCSGKGSPAKVFLNDRIYTRCPRATYLESYQERFWVQTYFECRNHKTMPVAGGALEQTNFCTELFEFLDEAMARYKRKRAQVQSNAQKNGKSIE